MRPNNDDVDLGDGGYGDWKPIPRIPIADFERLVAKVGGPLRLARLIGEPASHIQQLLQGCDQPRTDKLEQVKALIALPVPDSVPSEPTIPELVARAGGRSAAAAALGVSYDTVRLWTLGRKEPDAATFERLATLPARTPRVGGRPARWTHPIDRITLVGLTGQYGIRGLTRRLGVRLRDIRTMAATGKAPADIGLRLLYLLRGEDEDDRRTFDLDANLFPPPRRRRRLQVGDDPSPMSIEELKAAIEKLGGIPRTASLLGVSDGRLRRNVAGETELYTRLAVRIRQLLACPGEPPNSRWRAVIERRGVLQVAAAVGVGEGTVRRWASGLSVPSWRFARKLREVELAGDGPLPRKVCLFDPFYPVTLTDTEVALVQALATQVGGNDTLGALLGVGWRVQQILATRNTVAQVRACACELGQLLEVTPA